MAMRWETFTPARLVAAGSVQGSGAVATEHPAFVRELAPSLDLEAASADELVRVRALRTALERERLASDLAELLRLVDGQGLGGLVLGEHLELFALQLVERVVPRCLALFTFGFVFVLTVDVVVEAVLELLFLEGVLIEALVGTLLELDLCSGRL